jgi:hypothetical protein
VLGLEYPESTSTGLEGFSFDDPMTGSLRREVEEELFTGIVDDLDN